MVMQKLLFNLLSQENYLRVLQRGYFLAYRLGLLRLTSTYSYHYYIKKLIRKGDTIIDIGANLGYYSVIFAKLTGKTGKVYSVEPVKIFNKIFLEKAKRYPQITLYSCALGAEEKNIELVIAPFSKYLRTGLPHIFDPEKDGSLEHQTFKFESQMKIPSVIFKDLDKIDYLKCDVEGFEYVVLSEMKELIRKHKPKVQVEVWKENEEKILELFHELGYAPYKLHKSKLISAKKTDIKQDGDYIFLHSSSSFIEL